MGRSGAVRLRLPACGQGGGGGHVRLVQWWEHRQRWNGYWAGQQAGQERDSEGTGTWPEQGRGGPLALSLLPFLVPGQVDRRVAANAEARQV